jgi:hypothetical protein
MAITRFLFDTNIWGYLAKHVSARDLKRAARIGNAKILVAPSTLYESLRVKDSATRALLAAFITDPAWTHLKPEAYSESQELLAEIMRLRPHWLLANGNRGNVQRLKHDWGHTKAGFWSRVRNNPDSEAHFIAELGDSDLNAAREHANARRKSMVGSKWDITTPLTDVSAALKYRAPGYDGSKIEAWRAEGWYSTSHALRTLNHPYVEWLSSDVNIKALKADRSSWLKFWFYEVTTSRMPRFWLRWAFEYLQMFQKVTSGTPGDAQLATYLLEADLVISADKNIIRNVEAVRPYAPCSIAKSQLVRADVDGAKATLNLLHTNQLARQ